MYKTRHMIGLQYTVFLVQDIVVFTCFWHYFFRTVKTHLSQL